MTSLTGFPACARLAASLLLASASLSACAGMYAIPRPEGAPALAGRIEAGPLPTGPSVLGCDGFSVELRVAFNPIASAYAGGGEDPVGYLEGRAIPHRDQFRETRAERAVSRIRPWYLEGDLFENGTALLSLYQETVLPFGEPDAPAAKPFSTFRGTFADDRLDAIEEPPSCGRRLVAATGGLPSATPGLTPSPTPAFR